MENKINLEFTKEEFLYLSDFLNANYNTFKNLPKKLRTNKFSILENLVNNQFLQINGNCKFNLQLFVVQSSSILAGGDFWNVSEKNTTACT